MAENPHSTPQIKYKTSKWVWIALGLLVAVIGFIGFIGFIVVMAAMSNV